MFIVHQAGPDWRLRTFVRGYIQRDTPSTFMPCAIQPYVARLGVMLDFLFAGLYEIPICGTRDFQTCMPIALVGPQTTTERNL